MRGRLQTRDRQHSTKGGLGNLLQTEWGLFPESQTDHHKTACRASGACQ